MFIIYFINNLLLFIYFIDGAPALEPQGFPVSICDKIGSWCDKIGKPRDKIGSKYDRLGIYQWQIRVLLWRIRAMWHFRDFTNDKLGRKW